MNAAEVAAALSPGSRPRRSSRGPTWRVRCPAHSDRHPSLDITDAGGAVLLVCRAGCTQREVIEALSKRDLWRCASRRSEPRFIWPASMPEKAAPPSCCLRAQPCEHMLAFRHRFLIARMLDGLWQAAMELREKASRGLTYNLQPRNPSAPMTADELREGLRFAITFGAIVPAGVSESAIKEATEIAITNIIGERSIVPLPRGETAEQLSAPREGGSVLL
jgi:hypothetical protein